VDDVDSVVDIKREKLYNDKREESGPFDIVGDVHGCFDELQELLVKLGYVINRVEPDNANFGFEVSYPI